MVVCTFLPYNTLEQALDELFAGEDNHNCFELVCTGFGGTVRSHSDEGLGHLQVKQGSSPFLVSVSHPGALFSAAHYARLVRGAVAHVELRRIESCARHSCPLSPQLCAVSFVFHLHSSALHQQSPGPSPYVVPAPRPLHVMAYNQQNYGEAHNNEVRGCPLRRHTRRDDSSRTGMLTTCSVHSRQARRGRGRSLSPARECGRHQPRPLLRPP